MQILWQDVRYAFRMIARDPAFAVVLILTIGLGIGASTAVFSVANTLLFRGEYHVPRFARPVLIWMGAAVAISLLMACVNCANLLIARGMMRRKELAVRAAMGAEKFRVFRLLLTESVVLSLLGGVVGVLLAWWGADLLLFESGNGLRTIVDLRVLGFVLVLAIFSGILFGILPALDSVRSDGSELLKRAEEDAPRLQFLRGANLIVIGEVALAISLMIGAGMVLHFPPTLSATLLATFAGITLLLAMSGVYAVTCQMVGRRNREFSIRLALGASRNEVLRIVAREAMLLVVVGSVVGMTTGLFAAQALPSVPPASFTIVLAVALILAAAAAPASYFPARAASKIEPRTALKSNRSEN